MAISKQAWRTLNELIEMLQKTKTRGRAVMGKDNKWHLETPDENAEPERFRKSGSGLSPAAVELLRKMTTPEPSDLVKAYTNRTARVFRVGGSRVLDAGFAKLEKPLPAGMSKRAPQFPIDESERQGRAPAVAPWGSPRSEPDEAGTNDASAIVWSRLNPTDSERQMFEAYAMRKPMAGFPRA